MAKQVRISEDQFNRILNLQGIISEIDSLVAKESQPKPVARTLYSELDNKLNILHDKAQKLKLKKLKETRVPFQEELDKLLIVG